ncbi:MAG: hypothetical protein GAK29_05048 [Acinetobacter bereziniae]|uniref:Reverse transcriptase domain-containing protein n=1 Tax=Acinetobacter bereziniae TaxID=106648 RepID=A0A833P9X4_ACIBZ|nr:MAG: hypothetical protein GAK29_05048 [Acinetobacter bereziniae]
MAAYAPTNGDLECDEFWSELREVLDECKPGERIILLGDLNSWVGVRRSATDKVVGPYGDVSVNENGDQMLNVCTEKGLFISNTWFKHKLIHMYTWHRGDSKSLIDFVVYDERLRKLVKDTRAMRGSECGSDHYLVVSKVALGRKWKYEKKSEVKLTRVKVERLQEKEVQAKYEVKVNEEFRASLKEWKELIRCKDVDGAWEMVKKVIVGKAQEVCGVARVGGMKKDAWWNDDVKAAVGEKKEAYKRMIATKDVDERKVMSEEYRRKKTDAKVIVRESKDAIRKKEGERMQADFEGNKKLFWKWVKRAKGTKESLNGVCKENGEMVWNEIEVRRRWKEYFEELYGKEVADEATKKTVENGCLKEIETITEDEVMKAIRSLRNGKAAGNDGVTGEMLKYGGDLLRELMSELYNVCAQSARVPDDWKCAVLVPLYKGKGKRSECKNYRAISLLSVAGKVFGRILIDRVREVTECRIWDVQGGFMPGRGCVDQIFTLQQVLEKCMHVRKKVYCAFVDLEKAYDNVNRSKLWQTLAEYGVDEPTLNVLKEIYNGSKACVRVNGTLSDWFEVQQGVRQGCVMSPWLFNVFIDKCVRDACFDARGVKVGSVDVKVLLYADDAVLVAEDPNELQGMMQKLGESAKKMDLKINASKTKVVVFDREGTEEECKVTLNGEELEQVKEFAYLGRMFVKDGNLDGEIERRVKAGRKASGSLWSVAKNENVSAEAKVAVYKSVVLPTLLYGSESWVCKAQHMSKINAVGMDFLRSVCGKTRMDRVRNEWVRKECGVRLSVSDVYERTVLRWFGHVERMSSNRVAKQVYMGQVNGKLGRGRPRKRWLDRVTEMVKARKIRSCKNKRSCQRIYVDLLEAKELCKDRVVWRKLVKETKREGENEVPTPSVGMA